MAERIIVIGAGGFGRETLDVIAAINAMTSEPVWDVLGVVDDAPAEIQVERLQDRAIPLLGAIEKIREHLPDVRYVVGIGSPAVRARIAAEVDAWGGQAAVLVHPAATIGSRARMEPGTVVCGGVQVSTNVRLGRHVHLNPGAIIGHDTVLEDFVSVNPGAVVSGDVTVHAGTLIGAGAAVLQGIEVGADALIGASACVTKDVVAGTTMVGVPARARESAP